MKRWCGVLLCCVLAGCGPLVVSTGGDHQKPPALTSEIESETFKACQRRDAMAAKLGLELAEELASGKFKYDKPLMDRLAEINTHASLSAFREVTQRIAKELNSGATLDQHSAAEIVKQWSLGRQRASEPLPP